MGKATGFMEIERKTIANRPPLERVKDWDEIHEHFDEEKVQKAGRTLHGLRHTLLPYRNHPR